MIHNIIYKNMVQHDLILCYLLKIKLCFLNFFHRRPKGQGRREFKRLFTILFIISLITKTLKFNISTNNFSVEIFSLYLSATLRLIFFPLLDYRTSALKKEIHANENKNTFKNIRISISGRI